MYIVACDLLCYIFEILLGILLDILLGILLEYQKNFYRVSSFYLI